MSSGITPQSTGGRRAAWRFGAILVICAVAGSAPLTVGAANWAGDDRAFTVVTLPDTQYYAARHPEILAAQADWIVRAHAADRLAFVVHEGDIVDADSVDQWQRAARSLHRLDGIVPYVLSAGNHDYERAGDHITRRTLLDAFFPASTFGRTPCAQPTFEPGRIENSCQLMRTPAGPWLVLSLEFGPRDAVLDWADAMAQRYASLPTIVVTHAYLASDNSRYDHVRRHDQLWNPYRYVRDAVPGQVNDGEEMWRKLIVKHDNILFVICGHDLGDGVGRLTSVRPDGTRVHQLLANYQMQDMGGGGYLRLLQFSPGRRRVRVRTYSPYLNQFKTDPDNDFSLDY